jgi:spectrin beta
MQERCDRLLDAKNALMRLCDTRDQQLTEVTALSKFVGDANAAQRQHAALAALLRSAELGDSIEQAELLTRAHRELVATKIRGAAACAKVDELLANGDAIRRSAIARENEAVNRRVSEVCDALRQDRALLESLCEERQKKLDEQCRFLRFQAAASDLDGWLDERLAALKTRDSASHSLALAEKVRLLRVHHVFEAEIVKNRSRVEAMKKDAEKLLVAEKHSRAADIQIIINGLIEKWNKLLHASDSRAQSLEEAENLLKLEEEFTVVDGWVSEKELLIAADQLGSDYEHCEALQRRVNETVGGRVVDEPRVAELCSLAQTLVASAANPQEAKSIAERIEALNTRWNALQTALAAYKTRLAAAHELHAFRRDVDELDDRINALVERSTQLRRLQIWSLRSVCCSFMQQWKGLAPLFVSNWKASKLSQLVQMLSKWTKNSFLPVVLVSIRLPRT